MGGTWFCHSIVNDAHKQTKEHLKRLRSSVGLEYKVAYSSGRQYSIASHPVL